MPRILCIANFFRENGGGVEQMAHDLAMELGKMPGCEVTLAAHESDAISSGEHEEYTRLRIRANNILGKRAGLPLILPHPADLVRLRNAVKKSDVILVHDCVYLTHLLALYIAQAGIPAIVIKHTGEVRFSSLAGRTIFGFLNRRFFPYFLRKAAAVVFVTQAKRDNFPVIDGPKTLVIPNGIDTANFEAPSADRSTELLFVGRFVHKKGIGVIHEMARLMPERRFVLVGFGPVDPREWNLPNIICHWRPGRAEIAAHYKRTHALVLPGETEGTPLVALEALSCDTPVVIGDTGKSPDAALSSQMALLPVDVDRPIHTARAWVELLDDAIARSHPDRNTIVSTYGAERMARDYMDLIRQSGV